MDKEVVVKRVVVTVLLVCALCVAWLVGDTIGDLCRGQAQLQKNVMHNNILIKRSNHNIVSATNDIINVHGVGRDLAKQMLEQTVVVEINGACAAGVILDSKNGIILTCDHCVPNKKGNTYIIETYWGERFLVDQSTIEHYPEYDLAIIRMGIDLGCSDAKLDLAPVEVGDEVVVVGSPKERRHTLTLGVISAKNRDIKDGQGYGNRVYYYQTDAAINSGSSGGPWFNSKGEVIAISSCKLYGADNVGFGVPIYFLEIAVEGLEEEK